MMTSLYDMYADNYCRFCSNMFCCSKCRVKHEQREHHSQIDCDICIYGRIYWKNVPSTLLEHIKIHFPVYCLLCKRRFNEISDLLENHQCSQLYDSPVGRNTSSILISGNMDINLSQNNSSLTMPTHATLTSSTPMGAAEKRIQILSLESLHDLETNSLKSNDKTPTENTSKSKESFVQMFPLVTPLRSIIAKSKSKHHSGENSTKRVKFLNSELTPGEIQAELKVAVTPFKNMQTNSCSNFTTPNSYSYMSPSTPCTSQSEKFYTPNNRSDDSSMNKDDVPDDSATSKDSGSEKSTSGLSALGGLWSSMANVFKNVFTHVTLPLISYDECGTKNGVKRMLSPNKDQASPEYKRICVRGRRPVSEYSQHSKS